MNTKWTQYHKKLQFFFISLVLIKKVYNPSYCCKVSYIFIRIHGLLFEKKIQSLKNIDEILESRENII